MESRPSTCSVEFSSRLPILLRETTFRVSNGTYSMKGFLFLEFCKRNDDFFFLGLLFVGVIFASTMDGFRERPL